MVLKDIYTNSQYITDEEMDSSQIIAIANGAISEINTFCRTALPFFDKENYQITNYFAVTDSWQLRLIEPYLSFGIAANDTDSDARNFHYERFKLALQDFKNHGLGDIVTEITDGEGNTVETGFEGNSKRVVPINAKARANPFKGWW